MNGRYSDTAIARFLINLVLYNIYSFSVIFFLRTTSLAAYILLTANITTYKETFIKGSP